MDAYTKTFLNKLDLKSNQPLSQHERDPAAETSIISCGSEVKDTDEKCPECKDGWVELLVSKTKCERCKGTGNYWSDDDLR